MKHIILSPGWEYSLEPFPAYRINLMLGPKAPEHDKEYIHVKDIDPVKQFLVTTEKGEVLYQGIYKNLAEDAKAKYDAEQIRLKGKRSLGRKIIGNRKWFAKFFEPDQTIIKEVGYLLPENNFRVIKTRKNRNFLIIPGKDNSNKCLLFVGCDGGSYGEVGLFHDLTTGKILKVCQASNSRTSRIEIIILLEAGQTIAFHSDGVNTNEVTHYYWSGQEIEKRLFQYKEWDDFKSTNTHEVNLEKTY